MKLKINVRSLVQVIATTLPTARASRANFVLWVLRVCGAIFGCLSQQFRTSSLQFLREFLFTGASMPEDISRSLDIDPLCARCGSRLRFSCIEPEMNKPGFVHKVYECIKCPSTQSFVTPNEIGAH